MQFSVTYGAPETSLSLSHNLSFPWSASSQHELPTSQCSLREVSRLLFQQDAANRLSHSPQSPSCLQLQFPGKVFNEQRSYQKKENKNRQAHFATTKKYNTLPHIRLQKEKKRKQQ